MAIQDASLLGSNIELDSDAIPLTQELPEDLRDIAREELGETTQIREAAVKEIRIALEKMHLANQWLEGIPYLIMFLRHGKVGT